MLGKIENRRRRGWPRIRWLDSITDNAYESEQTLGDNEGQGSLVLYGVANTLWGCKHFMGLQTVRHKLVTEQQQQNDIII